jgi:shikimate kinase
MKFIDERMAALIQRSVGMSVEEIQHADTDEVHRSIEEKIGRKLQLGFEPGFISSGNVLIDLHRIIWP